MTEVFGCDVSSWQQSINWDLLASKVHFVYIRAGIGNDALDGFVIRNVEEAQRTGRAYGLYWYAKPGKDWRKHADSFAAAVHAWGGVLPPMVDVEENGGLGKTELESWLVKLVNRLEAAIGRPVGIYTSPGFWNGSMPLTNWAKNRDLWVAHWTSAAQPILPNEWAGINQPRTWRFWQWSANKNGAGPAHGVGSADLDLNRWNGDLGQFNAAYGVNLAPIGVVVPPPPPVPVVKRVELSTVPLNCRVGPGTSSAVAGTFQKWEAGLPFEVLESAVVAGKPWYRIAANRWVAGWLVKVSE